MAGSRTPSGERCVATGIGLVTPVAIGFEAFADALRTGKSRIGKLTRVDVKDLEFQSGGEVAEAEIAPLLLPSEVSLDWLSKLGVAAARQALADSGVDLARTDPARNLLLLATTVGPVNSVESIAAMIAASPASVVDGRSLGELYVPALVSKVISALSFCGETHILTHGCSAANYALTYAYDGIHAGRYDLAVVCGLDTITRVLYIAYNRFGILAADSRPFDAQRQGMVPAEGSGVLVLEAAGRAIERRARIYAELAGGACAADALQMLCPDSEGRGLHRAMEQALKRAGIDAGQVDYISACAAGTPVGDRAEAMAIKNLFEPTGRVPPTSAVKAQLGHLHGASSIVAVIACIAALRYDFLPPTLRTSDPDEICTFDLVLEKPRSQAVDVALANATTFSGTDSVVVLRKYPCP